MLTYIARRLATVPASLFLVVLVTFVVLRMTGDPVEIYLDVNGTPEQRQILTERLHLDRALPVQFAFFLADLLRGDFGTSLQFSAPAMPIVLDRVAATLLLVGTALALAISVGVLAGIVAAIRRDRISDLAISSLAVAGQSVPSFWLGILLIQVFALDLAWLPTSGIGTAAHLVLPAVTLATFLLPNFVLITRTSFLETVGEQFVVTARAKGASERRVWVKHVLPNAINPVLSFLGLQVGRLMGGSIITESIFAWPGVGRLIIGSIFQRDVPVVIAGVFVVSIAIVLANLAVDVVQSLIDPRIRLQ